MNIYRGPSAGDWLLLAVNAAFCIAAVFIGFRSGEWKFPLVLGLFFGLCGATAIGTIYRKIRDRRFQADIVQLPPSVEIETSLSRVVALGTAFLAVGAAFALIDIGAPAHIRLIGWFLILVGAVLLIGRVARLLPKQTLKFTPEGIVFGRSKFEAAVGWDNIAEILTGEFANNAMVVINVLALDQVRVEPAGSHSHFAKLVGQNRATFGGDFAIMTATFGVSAPALVAALTRYSENPESRRELSPAGLGLPAPAKRNY